MSTKEAYEIDLTSSTGPIPKGAYCLSPEDVLNHLRYKERAPLSARSFVRDFLEEFEPDLTCGFAAQEVNPCSETLKELSSYVRSEYLNLDCPPISFMELALEEQFSLCLLCRDRLNSAVEAKKQAFWDDLPNWFELPSWQVLNADFTKEDDF